MNLEIIDLSHSPNLAITPDFSGTTNLERLIVGGCRSLSKVHPSIGRHTKPEYMNIVDCKSLRILPSYLEMESLKFCTLNCCSKLQKFPEVVGNMNSLVELGLDGTCIKELPSSLKYLSG